jgi:hypothetical protein
VRERARDDIDTQVPIVFGQRRRDRLRDRDDPRRAAIEVSRNGIVLERLRNASRDQVGRAAEELRASRDERCASLVHVQDRGVTAARLSGTEESAHASDVELFHVGEALRERRGRACHESLRMSALGQTAYEQLCLALAAAEALRQVDVDDQAVHGPARRGVRRRACRVGPRAGRRRRSSCT